MKLKDAVKALVKKKEEQQAEESVVEVVGEHSLRKPRRVNYHHGIIGVMGLDPTDVEYEEMSAKLDELSHTNPALYRKIINMD
jgi:hypothetical protein